MRQAVKSMSAKILDLFDNGHDSDRKNHELKLWIHKVKISVGPMSFWFKWNPNKRNVCISN